MAEQEREAPIEIGGETGTASGVGAFLASAAAERTAGYFQDLATKLEGMPPLTLGGDRNLGVSHAWKWEQLEVGLGGPGTRPWTHSQAQELQQTGHVRGIEMHHINNVNANPNLASDPNNLVPVTREEHFFRHDQDWRKDTEGPLLDRHQRVEDANLHQVFKGEALTAIGVGGGAFLIGTFASWLRDRKAGWRTHLKRGAVSGGLATLGYLAVRGAGLAAKHLFHASSSAVSYTMMGAGLGFGMLVSGVVAWRRGVRGWDLAGEVGWTGISGLATMAAAGCAKGYILGLVAKGALSGAVGGPLGIVVGIGVAIAVGLVLEGIRRWWKKHDMTRKVGEWVGEGIQVMGEVAAASMALTKAVAKSIWQGTRRVIGAVATATLDGLAFAASQVWKGTKATIGIMKETAKVTKDLIVTGMERLVDVGKATFEIVKEVVSTAEEVAEDLVETSIELVVDGGKKIIQVARKVTETVVETVSQGLKILASPLRFLFGHS